MISLIMMFVAAMFNAVMDNIGDTVAFNRSRFQYLNPRFWNKEVSWQYATKVFGYKIDAWHISKSLMVISWVGAVLSYDKPVFNAPLDFILFGVLWNVSFNLWYKILRK